MSLNNLFSPENTGMNQSTTDEMNKELLLELKEDKDRLNDKTLPLNIREFSAIFLIIVLSRIIVKYNPIKYGFLRDLALAYPEFKEEFIKMDLHLKISTRQITDEIINEQKKLTSAKLEALKTLSTYAKSSDDSTNK